MYMQGKMKPVSALCCSFAVLHTDFDISCYVVAIKAVDTQRCLAWPALQKGYQLTDVCLWTYPP